MEVASDRGAGHAATVDAGADREDLIAALIGRHMSDSEIARELGCARRTVADYRRESGHPPFPRMRPRRGQRLRDDGAALRAARRERGLTIRELAARAGVSVRTVSRLERLAGYAAEISTLRRIADALELPLARLNPTPVARDRPTKLRILPGATPRAQTNPDLGTYVPAAVAAAREYAKAHELMLAVDAADFLIIHPGTLLNAIANELVAVVERHSFGAGRPALFLRVRDVKAFARDQRRSTNPQTRLHLQPEKVFEWAIRRGYDLDRASRLRSRAAERAARYALIRVNTGRPPSDGPPEHHHEWATAFALAMREQREAHAAHPEPGDPPPTKLGVALLVAEDDFAAHPERWRYDPNVLQDAASRRVWKAVKALQMPVTETRAA